MNLSPYLRKLYVRPIRDFGGSIDPPSKTVNITNVPRYQGKLPAEVAEALDFWDSEGFTIKDGDQLVQWVPRRK